MASTRGYDYSIARKAIDSEAIRLTRRWGALGLPLGEEMTSYYQVAGHIAHRRSQALLRDHICDRLNELLQQLGLPRLDIIGVPSAQDIDAVLAELQAGRIDLAKAASSTPLM